MRKVNCHCISAGCGWFLESVVVKDLSLHIQHEVPCGRWLSARDSDGLTVREFPVSFSTTFRDTPGEGEYVEFDVSFRCMIEISRRGRGGMTAYRGMFAHPSTDREA